VLGDNTGGGVVFLGPVWFLCVGVWISSGPPLYITIQLTICMLVYDIHWTSQNVPTSYVRECLCGGKTVELSTY